jgi:hypothetical protein
LKSIPGELVNIDAAQLRSMSADQLIAFGRRVGVDVSYLKDSPSAMYTSLVQHAFTIEDVE